MSILTYELKAHLGTAMGIRETISSMGELLGPALGTILINT